MTDEKDPASPARSIIKQTILNISQSPITPQMADILTDHIIKQLKFNNYNIEHTKEHRINNELIEIIELLMKG